MDLIPVSVHLLDILMATVFPREARTEKTGGWHFGFIILSDVMFIALLLAVCLPLIMVLTE